MWCKLICSQKGHSSIGFDSGAVLDTGNQSTCTWISYDTVHHCLVGQQFCIEKGTYCTYIFWEKAKPVTVHSMPSSPIRFSLMKLLSVWCASSRWFQMIPYVSIVQVKLLLYVRFLITCSFPSLLEWFQTKKFLLLFMAKGQKLYIVTGLHFPTHQWSHVVVCNRARAQ